MTLTSFTTEHPYRSSAWFLLIVVFVLIALAVINLLFLIGILVQVAVGRSYSCHHRDLPADTS